MTAAQPVERPRPTPLDRLGTPMSANATTALLLGSGELGKEMTIAFQKLGVEVHAVDRYANAPAHQVAHHHHVADIADSGQVRALIQRIQPDYVVPELECGAWDILQEIEERGMAVVAPTARACTLAAGREGIRTIATQELGLPTTAYRFVRNDAEFRAAFDELGFPCVAKPTVATAGRHHVLVENRDDIGDAWKRMRASKSGGDNSALVERFVDFDFEATILAVRSIDPATGHLATWFCEPIGFRHEAGILTEAWQPLRLSETARDNARSMAARITNELGGTGVYGVDFFVSGDEVYFSSVTPRPHDAGLVTLATQRFSQFDLHVRAILGLPIDVTLTSPGAAASIVATAVSQEISYTGVAAALAIPETDIRLFGKQSTYVGRHMGVALSTAETTDEARQRAVEAAHAVAVE